MTSDEFRAALEELGLSRAAFAERLGLDRTTVYRWTVDARAVPSWVPPVLEMMAERR